MFLKQRISDSFLHIFLILLVIIFEAETYVNGAFGVGGGGAHLLAQSPINHSNTQ